jgi:rhamnosyl/mannosyltransferase
MRILQLGKFFPIKGGVEKVEYDLMTGLSKHGINCDMLCAMTNGKGECMNINEYANLIDIQKGDKLSADFFNNLRDAVNSVL